MRTILRSNLICTRLIIFALVLASPLLPSAVLAQSARPSSSKAQEAVVPDEKSEQILRRAIEVMGGSSYLNARSIIGRGLFTQFKDGVSGLPSAFIDYLVYPDKERTEFKGAGLRAIQTNAGAKGWIFDGATKTIKDITPAQAEDFRAAIRTSVDTLLRGAWHTEGAKLSYAGRREAGIGRRNETVRLTYPDGFTVEFEFGARDGLPAKVIYKKKNAEGEEAEEEDHLAQFVPVGGINTAFVIDHFRAGLQTSRINYQSVEYNRPIPDSLFARPASIKALK